MSEILDEWDLLDSEEVDDISLEIEQLGYGDDKYQNSTQYIDLPLHDKQLLASETTATELLYGGAAGGGKSHFMRTMAIHWCREIPGIEIYLFRRTFPDLFFNHMSGSGGFPSMLVDSIANGWVKIIGHNTIVFNNGNELPSKIHLRHCQYEKDMWNYQGAEFHVLMIDELTQWPADMYAFLRSRCRTGELEIPDKYANLFPRILCSANPGGMGHEWVRQAFITSATGMEIHRAPKEEGGMLRQYIPARLEDNPTIFENDPGYEDRLYGLGDPELVKAMRMGDWDIVSGGAFSDKWDASVHVVEPFTIPETWYVDRCMDWGSSAPFAVLWVAESDGTPITHRVELENGEEDVRVMHYAPGSLFVFAEHYGWNGKPNRGCGKTSVEVAEDILKIERELGLAQEVNPGPADSQIYAVNDKASASIADHMEDEGVEWKPADKSAGTRVTGFAAFRMYLDNAIRNPTEKKGLYFFSNCLHCRRTLPTLPRSTRNPEDVDTDSEDHIYDALRYRLLDDEGMTTISHG